MPNANSSGEPNSMMIGAMMGRDTASTMAPKTPPNADTVNAAPNARAACPFCARG